MSKRSMGLGRMMAAISFILLLPLPFVPFFKGEYFILSSFLIPFFISILISFTVDKLGIKFKSISSTVSFIWLYGFLVLSFPFLGSKNATFIGSLFESISGLTTTGLSILDVEKLPKTLLLYRAMLQYIGGLGFVMMILLFFKGREEAELYEAEGHVDRVKPNIRKTAKTITIMYLSFLLLGSIEYKIAGMTMLDSVVHSMCALSTGGFSNRMLSIGAYDSLSIEIITSQLMILGTLDFSLLLTLLSGRIRDFFRSTEIKTFFSLLFIGSGLMILILLEKGYGVGSTFRITLFNALSALSTTGFSTLDYTTLPEGAVFVMIVLMIIGGGVGSTAGGIKLERFYIIFKSTIKSIREKISPEGTVIVDKMVKGRESHIIDEGERNDAFSYFSLYLLFLIFGTIVLSTTEDCPILYALFEYTSSLSTVGLSIGVTSPTTSPVSLSVMMIAMVMGRLEMMVIFQALFSKNRK